MNESALPEGASPQSVQRYLLAAEIATQCPPQLGREIALTGSASHGWSDDYSDIELNLWVAAMPDNDAISAWLERIEATDIIPNFDAGPDGSLMSIFTYRGIVVEAGWQTLAKQDEVLQTLLAGNGKEWLIHNAEIVTSALPLRTAGELAKWRTMVAAYPDTVLADVVAISTYGWQFTHWLAVRWSLIGRDERLALSRYLAADLGNVMRLVWAANRQWGPHLKWARHSLPQLIRQPDRLPERVNTILTSLDHTAVADTMRLMLEAIDLLPDSDYLSKLRNVIRTSLHENHHVGA